MMRGAFRGRLGRWAGYLDPVYLGNRLAYLSLSQGAFLGEEFPSASDSAPSRADPTYQQPLRNPRRERVCDSRAFSRSCALQL